jgi:hypothetical protein
MPCPDSGSPPAGPGSDPSWPVTLLPESPCCCGWLSELVDSAIGSTLGLV